MSENAVLPVTQHEQTTNIIGYSAKIGKQVMKAQLEKQIQGFSEQLQDLTKQKNDHFEFDAFVKYLKNKLALEIENDSEIFNLRTALNFFLHESDEFLSNRDLVDDAECGCAARRIKDGHKPSDNCIQIRVDLKVDTRDEESYDNQISYYCQIELDDYWIKHIEELHVITDAIEEIDESKRALTDKLRNIDEMVEQMEAQILVDHLAKTDEGQKILEVTSKMVSSVLGETPAMLSMDKDSE